MPLYVYACPQCKTEQEHVQKMSDPAFTELVCEACSATSQEPVKLKRIIAGGTNFVLAGGGWASTGYSK